MLLDIALIHNNAKVGSQIACALSKQVKERKPKAKTHYHHVKQSSDSDIVSINTYESFQSLSDFGTLQLTQCFSSTGCHWRHKC